MLLQVNNLRCGYGSLEVVHGISLHVCAGEIIGLLGANGAGKCGKTCCWAAITIRTAK